MKLKILTVPGIPEDEMLLIQTTPEVQEAKFIIAVEDGHVLIRDAVLVKNIAKGDQP